MDSVNKNVSTFSMRWHIIVAEKCVPCVFKFFIQFRLDPGQLFLLTFCQLLIFFIILLTVYCDIETSLVMSIIYGCSFYQKSSATPYATCKVPHDTNTRLASSLRMNWEVSEWPKHSKWYLVLNKWDYSHGTAVWFQSITKIQRGIVPLRNLTYPVNAFVYVGLLSMS